MDEIKIKGTEVSPEVIFNPVENKFSISGWSRPESPSKFYAPIKRWITEYGSKYLKDQVFEFKIAYFNTPSARTLKDILDMLDKVYKGGVKFSINWYYEDEGAKEEFEYEFAQGLQIPIQFIQID